MVQPLKSKPLKSKGDSSPSGAPVSGRAWLMPAMATIGFAVNFWAWALLSPLGPRFEDSLGLSSFEQSLLWRCRSWSAPWAASRWAP
ncbi:hypothetical protein SUDANB126_00560 [Streptomyces sp. enrichment culture]